MSFSPTLELKHQSRGGEIVRKYESSFCVLVNLVVISLSVICKKKGWMILSLDIELQKTKSNLEVLYF